MPRISLTFGDTVKSFPLLSDNPSKKIQKAVRKILERTANEVIRKLMVPGRDYNDHTFDLRHGYRKRRMAGFKYRFWNNTVYASYIENGTRYITARKMMHREVANGRARLRSRLIKLNSQVERGLLV